MEPNVIAGYVILSLFVVMCGLHLFYCFFEDEKHRRQTKCFCVLLLAISIICFMPNKPLIYIGALLGVIGDFFLLNVHHKPSFVAGSFFFIGGHFCYLSEMILILINNKVNMPYYVYIIVGGLLIASIFALYPFTKSLAGKLTMIGNFYMPFLLSMVALGIYAAVVLPANCKIGAIMFAIGYSVFFVSDCTLVYSTFMKDFKRRDFYIMLTYLLGEALIVIGLIAANGVL